MLDLKYTEILRLNKNLGESMNGDICQVIILSNIITDQFNEIFEYALRSEDINAKVNSGDYDNIVQDALKCNKENIVIVFWELANIIDGLQYKASLMSDDIIDDLVLKVCSEIDLVLNSLEKTSLIIFNKFSSLIFNCENLRQNNFDKICSRLNDYLQQKATANVLLIEIDKILAKLSISKSTDFRYFYSSKALYTVDFYKHYAKFISPIIKSIKGKAKKAIIFDCDNTLWKGILGEDGAEKIEMSGKTKQGVIFEEVQNLALELTKKGILIGFCSKNNLQDVEIIINEHPDMSIRNDNITIKKINWEDKATNLMAIAEELNIGLDSLVFVDDSDFETGHINDGLPQVTVLQVPDNLYEYPQLIRNNQALFFNVSQSKEDLKKTEIYKQQARRTEVQASYKDIEFYLRSLKLEISIHINATELIPRISQLTQKTNQFNLTTKRYTEADVDTFIKKNNITVFTVEVKDNYGDSGVTGVCIIQTNFKNKSANIDSLLMSCRIIGRNIELAFFDFLIEYLRDFEIKVLNAVYIKTYKNEQVNNFYEQMGFECVRNSNNDKYYVLKLDNYKNKSIDYIKVNYGRKN
jgi:FkbH-like protein